MKISNENDKSTDNFKVKLFADLSNSLLKSVVLINHFQIQYSQVLNFP